MASPLVTSTDDVWFKDLSVMGVAKIDRRSLSREVLLRWNGSAWSAVPSPDHVLGIGGGAGQVWSVGQSILRRSP